MNRQEKKILMETKSILTLLEKDARRLVDDYLDVYKGRLWRKEFGDDPGLFPKICKKRDAFEIKWYRTIEVDKMRWGRWECVRKDIHINKGKRHRYDLGRYAKTREIESINSFENQAEKIRKNVKDCMKIISMLQRLENTKPSKTSA